MRKLYPLVAGFLLCLATMKTIAQQSAFNLNANSDRSYSNSNFTSAVISNAEKNADQFQNNVSAENFDLQSTCTADFNEILTPNSTLSKKFEAISYHSEQRRPVYICWKFGDGKDTCIQYSNTYPGPYTVVHNYIQPGNYEVCVRIVYDGGCESTKCKVTTVEITCKADFEKVLLSSVASPLFVTYNALPWNSAGKKPQKICWNFGDGKDTCIEYTESFTGNYIVRHQYLEPGLYQVCVNIYYFGGCEAHLCKSIQIAHPDECKADFEKMAVTSTNNPLLAVFKALPWHSNNKKPKTICWRFGDGKDTCIEYTEIYTGTYPVYHNYLQPGNYEVCIKITYFGGCESYLCKQIQILRPDECRADFQRIPVTAGENPLAVGFSALPWNNNNKLPKVICWTFGDGKDTCIQYAQNFSGPYTVKHLYNTPGAYNVCIKIQYDGGCIATICKTIEVTRPDECKAGFERIAISPTSSPLLVYLKALPSNNNNKKPKEICWRFGDGKDTCIQYPENYTGTYVISHKYSTTGSYEVCIKIIYFGGCEAYNCKQLIIGRADECKADFERLPVTSTTNPLLVYFKALPANNNNKKPKQICWKFGDGKDTCIEYTESFTGLYVVRHEYQQPGTYEVCVKIIYFGGCEAYNCKQLIFERPDACKADFERVQPTANYPLSVYYKAIPIHNNNKKPKQICWKFGDGRDTCIEYTEDFSGPYIVKHEYREPGTYQVCIKITYFGGCEAYNCKAITLEGPGECRVKLFELTPSITSLVRGFFASPWSSVNKKPVSICWYFGDGTDTCIQLNPTYPLPQLFIRHIFPSPGVYKTCAKIIFEGGCIAYDCTEVVIRPTTNVCGGYMTDSLVTPRTFKFNGFAIHNPSDPVISFRWTFGDGSSATGQQVTHSYNGPGNYRVCLTINTQHGCETKICNTIVVPGNAQTVMQISPNPVGNILHLLFYSTLTETVNIKIVNANGVIVRNYTRNALLGTNNWDFDVSTLTPGSYMLYVQSPNQLSSQLFIKQ